MLIETERLERADGAWHAQGSAGDPGLPETIQSIVAARIDGLDRVVLGDLAWKHDKGVVFRVEDPEAEAPRAARGSARRP